MKIKNAKQKLIFCLIFLPLNLFFIWGNSLLDGDTSSQISSHFLIWLKHTLSGFGWVGAHLIRKIGHFAEYGCLGFVSAELFLLLGEEKKHRMTTPLLLCILAACADETIQRFVEGRGSSVIDVWIDVAGALTGICVLLALHYFILYCFRRKP